MKPCALVIEDRPEVAKMFQMTLERLDLYVCTAANLSEAEGFLRQQPPPDLVLLDLNLTETETAAYTVTRIPWIKSFNTEMMLLVISGVLTPELIQRATTAGAALTVSKIELQKQIDMWHAIETCLEKAPEATRERLAHPVKLLKQFASTLTVILLSSMKLICMLAISICIPFLSGCAGNLPNLPKGSYVEGTAGYTKDTGPTAGVTVHIPLSQPYRLPHMPK